MVNTQSCLGLDNRNLIDLDKWQELVNLLAELYDASTGAIVQFRKLEFNVLVSSDNPDNFLQPDSKWTWEIKSFCRHIIETDQQLYVGCPAESPQWSSLPAVNDGVVRSYCGIPIHWPNGEPFGTVCVIDTKPTVYNKPLLRLLHQLARLVESDIETACKIRDVEALAISDELTGLLNRRGLTLFAEQKLKDAARYELSIGLLYVDIDNLKMLNDKHGHQSGDKAITTLANTLKESCRETDLIARVGGDEFVVLCLLSTKRELKLLSDRICTAYQNNIAESIELSITDISIGSHIQDSLSHTTLDSLISESDKAMYAAKQNKRSNT